MESNDSLEIPDRGETSDIPGLPSGSLVEAFADTVMQHTYCRHRETTHIHTNHVCAYVLMCLHTRTHMHAMNTRGIHHISHTPTHYTSSIFMYMHIHSPPPTPRNTHTQTHHMHTQAYTTHHPHSLSLSLTHTQTGTLNTGIHQTHRHIYPYKHNRETETESDCDQKKSLKKTTDKEVDKNKTRQSCTTTYPKPHCLQQRVPDDPRNLFPE